MIATQEVKRSAPDGYTLYMTTLTHSVNAVLYADKKPYDPIADFTPITLVCHLPLVMVTKGDSPFNTAADVVKAAKEKPAKSATGLIRQRRLGASRWRLGRSSHRHEDAARALQGQRSGAHRSHGRPRQLHVLSDGRHRRARCSRSASRCSPSAPRSAIPTTPNVPTMSESGFPGFEQYTRASASSARRPAAPVVGLERVDPRVARKADTKEKLNKLGAITEGGSTPAEFRAWLAKDLERWERVNQGRRSQAGIRSFQSAFTFACFTMEAVSVVLPPEKLGEFVER
jgi:hypothetical protein